MMPNFSSPGQKVQMIDRDQIIRLLNKGLDVESFRFTRQAALAWLAAYPGDLEVNLYLVKVLLGETRIDQASKVLEKVLNHDPLYVDALKIGVEIFSGVNAYLAKKCNGVLQALGEQPSATIDLPAWGSALILVKQLINNANFEGALSQLMPVLGDASHPELADLMHLEITSQTSDAASVLNLARLYQKRWPECLQINLVLAKSWMETGNDDEAVKVLHYCAAQDATAQVPQSMWGESFPYKPLYPGHMEIVSNFSVPAEVAGKLGLNQLVSGPGTVFQEQKQPIRTEVKSFDGYKILEEEAGQYPSHPKVVREEKTNKNSTIVEVEEELRKVAESINQPVLTNSDNRFPNYVILTMKKGLEHQYGAQSAQVILSESRKLAKLIHSKNGWGSFLFLPDDLEICGRYGVTPADSVDPWKIKLALVDLDKTLHQKGERIGAVLIVGGEDVVPFHKLPNPTDDSDIEVKSDNPYGSLDTNYFVSDWPVGRLPGETGSEAGLLLTQIRNTLQYHEEEAELRSWTNRIVNMIRVWNQPWLKHYGNSGYTASVWKRSSLAAFRPVGESKNLYLSPNGKAAAFQANKLNTSPIGYFNLHGVEDGSDWYGQKDPTDNVDGPDYPVALRPSELSKLTNSPRIVFSEACYGGHIFNKKENESIALTFLGAGVLAVIASSTISYGSVNTPLIGADLLAYLTLKYLAEGLPIGNALQKARIDFVREMNRRQGYLDGEDQKTLISFNLYGDPLVVYDPYQGMAKNIGREAGVPIIKTVCDRTSSDEKSIENAPAMINTAKKLVKDYLPGIEYAEVKLSHQQARALSGSKTMNQPKRVVVSFSKQVQLAERTHKQFAKVTLDQQGKMVKLAISR